METKQQILGKAESLFMRYGIKSVSMDDMARELGISKKTLYQHFENKDDLIRQVMTQHVEDEKKMIASIRSVATDAIDEMLRIARYVLEFLESTPPRLMYDLRKYHADTWAICKQQHDSHLYENIRSNLERGIEQGLYRRDLDVDIIARLYGLKSLALVDDTVFPPAHYPAERVFGVFMEYHMYGIMSARGLELWQQHRHRSHGQPDKGINTQP